MRIHIAGSHETLRSIAAKNNAVVYDLLSLNPHIADPNHIIAGLSVNLPPISAAAPGSNFPACPPSTAPYLDNWIPLTPLEQMARTEYDAIVVGTGAGGGAALWRLCERWKKKRQADRRRRSRRFAAAIARAEHRHDE